MYQSIPNQTVLIIKDSQQENSGCQQLLQDNASVPYHLLIQSADPPTAVLCDSQPIDGIVLDGCTAPLKVLSQIQQQFGSSCPPIVVIGEDTVETAVSLLKAGVTDYLVRSRLTRQQLCVALQSAIQSAIARSTSVNSRPASPSDQVPPNPMADYAEPLDQGAATLRASSDRYIDTLADIDDQKRLEATLLAQLERYQCTEAALQTANQKISRILESMTDAFVALDRDWRITYVNQTAARINHVSPDVLIGQSHWDVWPDTRDALEERYRAVMATQTPAHFDYFYAGRQRWYEIHAYPSADGLGLYFRDIHNRKQAETALQQAEERLRIALQNSPVTVFNQDRHLRYTWVHKPILHQPNEVIGKCDRDFLPPKDAEILTGIKQQVLDTGIGARQEVKITQDGIDYYFDLTVEPLRDEQNTIIGITGASVNISALKQAATELKKSEERLRLAVEGAQMATWDADLVSGRAIWSELHFTMLGYEPTATGEASEAMWSQRIHPDDHERVDQEWQRSCREHRCFRAEYRVIRADNDQIAWLAGLGNFIYDNQGQAIRASGVLFDISDRKQAEAALQESEERFRTLADNISQFAWMADASGWIFWYNQRWFDYTGTTLEEMQGWNWQRVHHPDHVVRVVEHFSHSIQTGEPWEDTFPLRGQDGTFRWFLSRALPIRDEAGNILRWFGTNTDITEQKQAEAALAQRETELRLVTNTVPALISFVDAEQRYRFVNHRYETWFRQPASAICGKSLLEVLGEKAYETIRPHVEQVLAGQEVTYEVQIPYKDGGSRAVSATYVPRFNQQGAVEGFVALVNDISDRKRAEDEREQLLQREQAAREAAERANRVKDEFLTVLSHELRSPLNPILGWAKLLQKRQFDEAQTAQALASIERNAKLQTQLIDDLLDVARILRGKLKLNQAPIRLATVVDSAIETMWKTAEAKSITLNANVPDVGHIYGDNTRLQQILWNLLSNAIKFTSSGGQVEVRLERVLNHEVMALRNDGIRKPGRDGATKTQSTVHPITPPPLHPSTHPPAYAQITVADTGKGINSEFLPHIFESFRQEDASTTRQYGGLGLGLAIVRYLVNAHGGTVAADSAGEGCGATFTVCLPLLEVKTAMQKTNEGLLQQDIDLAGMRILVVDDEPDARDLLEILLTQHGANVQVAASASEALSALAAFHPELLISDIGMPGMDGYDLIRHIRSLSTDQGGNIPAIALTAYARDADSQQALASGYQHHITKPLDLELLLQTVTLLKGKSEE